MAAREKKKIENKGTANPHTQPTREGEKKECNTHPSKRKDRVERGNGTPSQRKDREKGERRKKEKMKEGRELKERDSCLTTLLATRERKGGGERRKEYKISLLANRKNE